MIQQLATTIYSVSDLARTKQWLAQIFEITPYFDEPFYVGYNVGGFELGLLLDESNDNPSRHHPVLSYWRVDNLEASLELYQGRGAKIGEPLQDVGGGVKVASILDPDGNHVGLIENPVFTIAGVGQ